MEMIARIQEIFTSLQGEGIFSGKRQLFVRFFGCNLRCAFCDTPQPFADAKGYSIEELFAVIKDKATPVSVHSVSLTGGEPLVQSDFLKAILPRLKQAGYRIYLDTNGTLPERLRQVVDYIDIVAMDIKLPSSTGLTGFWKEHSEFLTIAMKKSVFVKVVITDKSIFEDFRRAVALVRGKNPHIAFVLQPVSPFGDTGSADPAVLENFKNIASEYLYNVRVVPQMHKLYGVK
jgi:organic radical activating enzyme